MELEPQEVAEVGSESEHGPAPGAYLKRSLSRGGNAFLSPFLASSRVTVSRRARFQVSLKLDLFFHHFDALG